MIKGSSDQVTKRGLDRYQVQYCHRTAARTCDGEHGVVWYPRPVCDAHHEHVGEYDSAYDRVESGAHVLPSPMGGWFESKRRVT